MYRERKEPGAPRRTSRAQPRSAEAFVHPGGFFGGKGRVGNLVEAAFVIAAQFVTAVDERLEVEHDVAISRAQRDAHRRQPFCERTAIHFALVMPRGAADADEIASALGKAQMI